uniref:SSD domain-containing protein n=2 Tax=Ascaris TaxID=6251 RepID=A0A0M3I681_ASCLU
MSEYGFGPSSRPEKSEKCKLSVDFLAQFVVEVKSYEAIFDLGYLNTLCSVRYHIDEQLSPFFNITPYRNVYHIPNYMSCLSPNNLANCSYLTESDVAFAKDYIDYCRTFRREIIECRRDCYECEPCDDVPLNCSTQMIFDIFYRILPKNLDSKPFYLNSFLPIFTLMGYHSRGFFETTPQSYLHVQNALKKYGRENQDFVLKGLSMDIKRDILFDGAKRDSILAAGAALCVFVVIFLYSLNVLFCIGVSFMLIASVLCALAVYSFFTPEFPLLNLVVFVLLLAIGSDDAFLLMNSFPQKGVNKETIHECLSHTSAAMLLTSSSTAVPFFTNIFSSVVVFRCFGLFAGLTLIFNYILEISFLPALLILQDRYLRSCAAFRWRPFAKVNYLMCDVLPYVIVAGRYVWVASLSLVFLISCYVVGTGLHFPEYNPLQLFISSNEHEWYDNNAEQQFEFFKNKIALSIGVRLIWGLSEVQSTSVFRVDQLTPVRHDPAFQLRTSADLQRLAKTLKKYRELDFIKHDSPFWPERYLAWSRDFSCKPGEVCCNLLHSSYNESDTDHCMRLSTLHLFTQYNDTPIFDNKTFDLAGYTASLPTRIAFSYKFSNLSKTFQLLRESFGGQVGGWWTIEWSLMCVWYDLLASILSDCRQSVLLSFAVVAVFALAHLRGMFIVALISIFCIVVTSVAAVVALGWVIGVLEAVILVLVVGLSFDFTLHYGASVPKRGCAIHRVCLAAKKSSIPVGLAALSSIVAGAAMLIAETHAFYQVGIFLVTSTSVSWLFATFFFLPLLTFVLFSSKQCELCHTETKLVFPLAVTPSSY